MGNKHDGQDKHTSSLPEHTKTYGEDGLSQYGNADANKLAIAFKHLSKDGLTEVEIEKLKQLDKELQGAEFHCLSGNVTLVTQEKNGTETNFVVLGNGQKQDSGFSTPHSKPARKL